MPRRMVLVFGSQLFPRAHLKGFESDPVFMAEDDELCTYFRFHKHKLQLFLSAMRHYARDLERAGFKVDYHALTESSPRRSFEDKLEASLRQRRIEELHGFEIEDLFMEVRIRELCRRLGVKWVERRSPMFLTSREEFREYLGRNKKPFMKTFYEERRRKTGILMDAKGQPTGGRFSFDEENRKKLPKGLETPTLPRVAHDEIDAEVARLVQARFADHPGRVEDFWLPTTRPQALSWLKDFLEARFAFFGPYEDAIQSNETFLFHSVLTPMLNIGLITPDEVVEKALQEASASRIAVNSVEGFIRQVIGWREFIRGIYRNFAEAQASANFFGHQRRLNATWYTGETQIPVVDAVIRRVVRHGYCHHIERLMVLANIMNLAQIHPSDVYRWFMEMFVDSSDWVMGPNVYGMGLFSDGGIFATKPYICGSNYWLKMSDFKKGPWCDAVDGLYWRFIDRHREFFTKQYRMNVMIKSLDTMERSKKNRIWKAADHFLERTTS